MSELNLLKPSELLVAGEIWRKHYNLKALQHRYYGQRRVAVEPRTEYVLDAVCPITAAVLSINDEYPTDYALNARLVLAVSHQREQMLQDLLLRGLRIYNKQLVIPNINAEIYDGCSIARMNEIGDIQKMFAMVIRLRDFYELETEAIIDLLKQSGN